MSEEKKEQKIDLKDRMLSDDDLGQVSGGTSQVITCPYCGLTNTVYRGECLNCYNYVYIWG